MDHPARGVPPFMETTNHIDPGTGPKVGTALMMVSSTFSMREMVFGRGKLAISLGEPAFLALLKGQCVSPKQIETANHSADILSYVSLHFLKGYQTCSRQISELFLFNGGASENAPSQQIEGSAGLCQEPPGWPRAASFCSMEFTCNIESTSHSLDPADQQQKVNIIIYNHI